MLEFLTLLAKVFRSAHDAAQVYEILKKEPQITAALAVLLAAGILAALMIRKRRYEVLSLRNPD